MGKCSSKNINSTENQIIYSSASPLPPSESLHLKQVPNFRITENARSLIRRSLKKNQLFSSLSVSEVSAILPKIVYCVSEADSKIIEQGSEGSLFFIINSGSVNIIVNDEVKVSLQQEDCFGELALLLNSKRKATVMTQCKSSFWVISSETFQSALNNLYMKHFDKIRVLISSTLLFKNLPDNQIDEISRLAKILTIKNGKNLINEGDIEEVVYILKEGTVGFYKGNKKVNELSTVGEMFGEGALLNGGRRMASCTAIGDIEVISVSSFVLRGVFGENYEARILKNIAKNSIYSDSDLWFFEEKTIQMICDRLKWVKFKDKEVVINNENKKERSFIVIGCGTLTSNDKSAAVFKPYSVIGFNNYNEKQLRLVSYYSQGDSVVGKISVEDLNRYLKFDCDLLCEYIEKIKFLYTVSFFSALSLESIKKICVALKLYKVLQGTVIFKHSDQSSKIYIVKSGSFGVYREDGTLARIVVNNDIFGERCLYNEQRAASVTCTEEGEIFSLSKYILLELPEIYSLIKEAQRKEFYQKKISLAEMLVIDYGLANPDRYEYIIQDPADLLFYSLTVVPKSHFTCEKDCSKIVLEKNILIQVEHHLLKKLVISSFDRFNVYFVSEFVKSSPLRSALGEISKEKLDVFVVQIAKILEYLHRKDIIYRDLNPDNILIDSHGNPFLWNFRNSIKIKGRAYSKVGNDFYKSPEMIIGRGYSKSTDIWSLGMVLYELYLGKLPFDIQDSDSPQEIYEKILAMKLSFNNECSQEVKNLISNMLCKSENRLDTFGILKNIWLNDTQIEEIVTRNIPGDKKSYRKGKGKSFGQFKAKKIMTDLTKIPLVSEIEKFNWEGNFS